MLTRSLEKTGGGSSPRFYSLHFPSIDPLHFDPPVIPLISSPASLFVYTIDLTIPPPSFLPFQFPDDTAVDDGRPTSSHILPDTDRDRSKLESGLDPLDERNESPTQPRRRFAGHDGGEGGSGRYRDCGQDRPVDNFDPIESPRHGFHDGRRRRRVDIWASAACKLGCRLIYGGGGRADTPRQISIFRYPLDIYSTSAANIADRWWHSAAPNLSRLSYTSTDFFFKLIPSNGSLEFSLERSFLLDFSKKRSEEIEKRIKAEFLFKELRRMRSVQRAARCIYVLDAAAAPPTSVFYNAD